MKVGIYGHGFLGQHMRALMEEHHSVVVCDPALMYHGPLTDLDLAIVCVPTPPGPNGECNISIVNKVVRETDAKLILIKSTVAPGTTELLRKETKKRVVFSPEYMGESKYFVPDQWVNPTDSRKHGWMVVGGEPEDCGAIIDIFLPILGPTCRFREMTSTQAELVKYAENSFFALKVTYANELRRICDAFGVGYHAVREGWIDDPRANPNHTAAFKQEPGFGGKCLPKDINALAYACREAGYPSKLLEAVIEVNSD